MITFTFSGWVAVVMEIKDPRLKLCILEKVKTILSHKRIHVVTLKNHFFKTLLKILIFRKI